MMENVPRRVNGCSRAVARPGHGTAPPDTFRNMPVDPRILSLAVKVKGKRPRAVIDHIIKYGHVTTEELKEQYGYNHPPRAARDVREQGIPLETFRTVSSDKRSIGGYRFGDPSKIEKHKLGGRKIFSKQFKQTLLGRQGPRCALTGEPYSPVYLSIDHRIPYEVAGDEVSTEEHPEAFMLISAAAQRQKSWTCEHCDNLLAAKSRKVCRRCFWASPEDYEHIAGEQRRRVDVYWVGDDVKKYIRLSRKAKQAGVSLSQFIRNLADRES